MSAYIWDKIITSIDEVIGDLSNMKILTPQEALPLLDKALQNLNRIRQEIDLGPFAVSISDSSCNVDDLDNATEDCTNLNLENSNLFDEDTVQEDIFSQRAPSIEDPSDDKHVSEEEDQFDLSQLQPCNVCGTELKSKRKLYVHLRKFHPNNFTFSCQICGKAFKTKNGLDYHIEVKHPEDESQSVKTKKGKLFCSEEGCKYVTHSKVLLRSHRYAHSIKIPIRCSICKKDYVGGPNAFQNHMKMHAEERNFKCDLCNKAYVSQSRLTHHRTNSHSDPKFHCDRCSKLFRSKSNFFRHLKLHSDGSDSQIFPATKREKNTSRNVKPNDKSVLKGNLTRNFDKCGNRLGGKSINEGLGKFNTDNSKKDKSNSVLSTSESINEGKFIEKIVSVIDTDGQVISTLVQYQVPTERDVPVHDQLLPIPKPK